MTDLSTVVRLAVATLGGAAVGVERQRSGHASGAQAHFGGVRTFTMLGGVAGLAGWLADGPYAGVAIALVVGAVALVVAAYVAASRRDVDGTTEVAALVVIAAGVLAGIGSLALASGIIAIATLLLVEKSELHALVARIDDQELRAAARFAVMAVVILPLLPQGPYGPLGGIRPRELWLLVLFFAGLSFAGFIARRSVGPGRGFPVAGLLGGLVSSTSVTLTFARLSRREHAAAGALGVGVVGACTMLFPRVMLASFVLNAAVARALVPYLAAPFVAGLATLAVGFTKTGERSEEVTGPANPLQIGPALQMALTFQLVLFGVAYARQAFGQAGLLASGAVLGLTDVDALTISMAKSALTGTPAVDAAQAVAVGVLVNTVLKLAVALVLGTPRFRRAAAPALAAMIALIAAALAFL